MENEGLTNEQTEMVVQFQDLSGIEDMSICRDILIRHQWDLEVAIHEQLNIREGRPSMYASAPDVRAPQVVNDRFLQHVFSAHMPGGRGSNPQSGFTSFLGYIFNYVFQFCYNTISSIVSTFLQIFRNESRIVTDPLGDVTNFIRTYSEKYPVHPTFYQGTYAQALNDAKRELKFLLIYLHSEHLYQLDVHAFCSQTLSDPIVIDYINKNFLFWGCDISSPEGYRVSHSINAKSYPILVLIGLRANKMVIMGRMEGDCLAEELLRRLQMIVNDNDVWLAQARSERIERSLTQSLRRSQDEAYERSLKADQEKERIKRQAKEQLMKEAAIEADKRRIQEEKMEEIARQKIELASQVPTEPTVSTSDTISLVFKLPNGARIERRFLYTDMLKDVYHYMFCHPASPNTFEITTNFPKKILCTQDTQNDVTLKSAGLKNREVLFVNDLDA